MADLVYDDVKEEVKRVRRGVVILIPPGTGRVKLAESLRQDEERVVDEVYLYTTFGVGKTAVDKIAERVLEAMKAREPPVFRAVVVPRSTMEALHLKNILEAKRKEGEDLPRFEVKLLYLPRYYARRIDREVEKAAEEVAFVRHEFEEVKLEGVAPKLIPKEDAEALKEARRRILALENAGRPLVETILHALKEGLVKTAASAVVGPLFVPGVVLAGLLKKLFPELPAEGVELARDAVEGFLEALVQRRRETTREELVALITAAAAAAEHIDDDRLETLVDQVALSWRLDIETFKTLVKNLAALARDKLPTAEDLQRLKEAIRQEVEKRLAEIEKRLEAVRRRLDKVEEELRKAGLPIKVLSLKEVEGGLLYVNFRVEEGMPVVETAEGAFPLVTTGRFEKAAEEVLRRLSKDGVVVIKGPKGIGKSTLAAYVAWRAASDLTTYVMRIWEVEKDQRSDLNNALRALGDKKLLVIFDPTPLEIYKEPGARAKTARKAVSETSTALEELLKFAEENRGRGLVLAVMPDDLYDGLDEKVKKMAEKYLYPLDLREEEFLTEVVYEYSGCRETPEEVKKLAERIAEFNGGYTLVARYAGLWLRERGCRAEEVEAAVGEAKKMPKLFFASYVWHVLLRGSGDLAKKAAVPLLLHAHFGPVPVGVTYATKAANPGGVWRLMPPEELEGASLNSLEEDKLKPIAMWLARLHEDLVEETLRDLAGLNGE